eukprot:840256-Pyramimonas_sp.AAC.1
MGTLRVGLSQACGQTVHRPMVALCTGCAQALRRMLPQACIHPMHRQAYDWPVHILCIVL